MTTKARREALRAIGSIGGSARLAKMTPKERSALATRAVNERWRKWREAREKEGTK